MNDLFEFEQQFGVITADITSKTCLLLSKETPKVDELKLLNEVNNLLKDAHELLEHMELEVRETPQDQREKLMARVKCYEVELKRLEGEFHRSRKSLHPNEESLRQDLFGGAQSSHSLEDDQKQRLLNNTETLERTSMRLNQSYRSAIDSEQIGAQILGDLQHQRETLTRARERLHHTDVELDQSSRVLNTMMKRVMQNKFILGSVIAFVLVVIVGAIYSTFS